MPSSGAEWLTPLGLLANLIVLVWNGIRDRNNARVLDKKSDATLHAVNGTYSAAQAEIRDLKITIAKMLESVAKKSGATEDITRADVAMEQVAVAQLRGAPPVTQPPHEVVK